MKAFLTVITGLLIIGCARSPLKSNDQLFRDSKSFQFKGEDDLGRIHFQNGIEKIIAFHEKKQPVDNLQFGKFNRTRADYLKGLKYIHKMASSDDGYKKLPEYIKKHFHVLEVYGEKEWGDVFITSYYQPVIQGRKRPTKKYYYPLYELPKDLVSVQMGQYIEQDENLEVIRKTIQHKSRNLVLSGRLIQEKGKSKIVPYLSRKEIDESKNKISKVLAYVDPIDAFFLHIQGSGVVQFKKTKMKVGYAGQNGHKYHAIGRELLHVIPKEEMSMQRIEQHLRTLNKEELFKILQSNNSYIFFRNANNEPTTYSGSELIDGRTIATDVKYFPKGVLAWLEFPKPAVIKQGNQTEVTWENSQRFVFDQDTGGAIRGPGRLDLYWGEGPEAEIHAGIMKERGRLYYIIPNSQFLKNYEEVVKMKSMTLGQSQ